MENWGSGSGWENTNPTPPQSPNFFYKTSPVMRPAPDKFPDSPTRMQQRSDRIRNGRGGEGRMPIPLGLGSIKALNL